MVRTHLDARSETPTVLSSEDHQQGPCLTVLSQRSSETFQAAKEIHGAGLNNASPAHRGLLTYN